MSIFNQWSDLDPALEQRQIEAVHDAMLTCGGISDVVEQLMCDAQVVLASEQAAFDPLAPGLMEIRLQQRCIRISRALEAFRQLKAMRYDMTP